MHNFVLTICVIVIVSSNANANIFGISRDFASRLSNGLNQISARFISERNSEEIETNLIVSHGLRQSRVQFALSNNHTIDLVINFFDNRRGAQIQITGYSDNFTTRNRRLDRSINYSYNDNQEDIQNKIASASRQIINSIDYSVTKINKFNFRGIASLSDEVNNLANTINAASILWYMNRFLNLNESAQLNRFGFFNHMLRKHSTSVFVEASHHSINYFSEL